MAEELEIIGPSQGYGFGSSYLFKNIESYPGQLYTVPVPMSVRLESKIGRRDSVRGARHVERTNEHIRGGLDRKTNMVIGASLTFQPKVNFDILGLTKEQGKALNESFKMYFDDWAYDIRLVQDGEGHYDFGGLMWMMFRNLIGPDGECCAVMGYDEDRAAAYNHRWASFLTVVDPDRIETPGDRSTYEGSQIFQGRRVDPSGRMIGLYIRKRHPNDVSSSEGITGQDYEYVERETQWGRPVALHWFMKYRAGAQRGMSTLITVLRHSTMLDRFDDAQLQAAVVNAMFAMFVKSNAGPEAAAANMAPGPQGANWFEQRLDARLGFYNKAKIKFGSQPVAVLPDEDSLEFASVNRSASDPQPFINSFLRKLSIALDMPFEQFSNDYSQSNYSSTRAALLDAWRGVRTARRMFTRHIATPIAGAVIEEAIAKGWVTLPAGAPDFDMWRSAYMNCEWTGPGMGWIDPLKEAAAKVLLLNNRLASRRRVMSEADGVQWDEELEDIADEEEYADELGIFLTPEQADAAHAEELAAIQPDPNDDPDDPNPADEPKPLPKKKDA